MRLSIKHLSPVVILEFCDRAFSIYHSHPPFLDKVKCRFGEIAVSNVKKMLEVKLRRRLLER